MPSVTVEQEINAPLETVFNQMTNIGNWTELVSGITSIEQLTDGPFQAGTRWKETRIMFGKEATEEMEVTKFHPNKGYTIEANSCGALYSTEFSFHETATGTVAKMEMQVKPVTMAAKLMSPVGWMMSGVLKKCLTKDLTDIKQSIEGN